MRLLTLLLVLLFSCALALGQQAVVTSGYATNSVYGVPFVPRLTTPSISFATPALQVGARNATAGNVAGATNGTVPSDTLQYGARGWYHYAAADESEAASQETYREFDLGMASFETPGVAAMIANAKPVKHASRVYTNQDVEQVNQTNGVVKFSGKTEHLQ